MGLEGEAQLGADLARVRIGAGAREGGGRPPRAQVEELEAEANLPPWMPEGGQRPGRAGFVVGLGRAVAVLVVEPIVTAREARLLAAPGEEDITDLEAHVHVIARENAHAGVAEGRLADEDERVRQAQLAADLPEVRAPGVLTVVQAPVAAVVGVGALQEDASRLLRS